MGCVLSKCARDSEEYPDEVYDVKDATCKKDLDASGISLAREEDAHSEGKVSELGSVLHTGTLKTYPLNNCSKLLVL